MRYLVELVGLEWEHADRRKILTQIETVESRNLHTQNDFYLQCERIHTTGFIDFTQKLRRFSHEIYIELILTCTTRVSYSFQISPSCFEYVYLDLLLVARQHEKD